MSRRIARQNNRSLIFTAGFLLVAVFFYWKGSTAIDSIATKQLPMAKALSTKAGSFQRPVRILCFGDSLTAGMAPPHMEDYPYAPYLEEELKKRLSTFHISVSYRGFPGWTAADLLFGAKDQSGLQTMIRKLSTSEPLSLVILLAGTNDMGTGVPPDEIVSRIQALHQLCYDERVPQTIAIGVPPSAFPAMNPDLVNEKLKSFCETESRTAFHPFPFEYAGGDKRWSPDGLHFSPQGYEALGVSLAPLVEKLVVHNRADSL